MRTIKANEGTPYEAPRHFNLVAVKKVTTDFSRRTTVSVSTFQPNGGAEMSSSDAERTYYVLSGSITVKGQADEHELHPGDLIYIAPGEQRSIAVNNEEPARTLVIAVTP